MLFPVRVLGWDVRVEPRQQCFYILHFITDATSEVIVLGLVHYIPGDFEASSTGNASLGGGDKAPIDIFRFLWPKFFTRPVDSLLNFTINVEVVLK